MRRARAVAAVTTVVVLVVLAGALGVVLLGGRPPVETPAGSMAASSAPTVAPTPLRSLPASAVRVPSTIDATGATDAGAALSAWLATVPDGATVAFPAGGTFRLETGIVLRDRTGLTLEGQGATLLAAGDAACGRPCSNLVLDGGNRDIVIRGFVLAGTATAPGTFDATREQESAIVIVGGGHVEITDVVVRAVSGDALTLTGDAPDWPQGVWFHDAHVESCGRNGVAVIAGRDVTVERVAVDRAGYSTFDIEPNTADQGASGIRFLDNTAGTWSNSFLSADGAAGSVVDGVTVSGNTVTGGSLLTVIDLARRRNVVFTGNTSLVTARGPVLYFAHVDGLTVTGNTQPLASGTLASILDSTGVTTDTGQ